MDFECYEPAALEELGLAAALQALGRFFERNRPDLKVSVRADELPPLSPGLETAVYRVAQEALTNVARHAKAEVVEVALVNESDELVLTVADNGGGLDPTKPGGRGLLGMRERVAAYGGTLTLTPARPQGLKLRAAFLRQDAPA